MTSIFLELQLQGLNHPGNKREVENSEHRASLLKMISLYQESTQSCGVWQETRIYSHLQLF